MAPAKKLEPGSQWAHLDRDGDGIKEYRCTGIKKDGKRCKNKTENKNKRCYAHQ